MTDALIGPIIIGVASMIGATVAAFLVWLATRRKTNLDYLTVKYDQMQEDVDRERSARLSAENAFRSEITGLRIEMVGLRAEVRVRDDYIGLLRRHIEHRRDPPPPAYPAELTGAGQGGM